MANVLICLVLAGLAFLGIRSYRKKIVSGCCGSDSDTAPKKIRVQDRNLRHYTYAKILEIDGMTCRNCATHVQNVLNSLNDCLAKVNLGEKKARVYMKEDISDQLLRKTVSAAGYTVMSISRDDRQ